jgi:hypothetical protein
MNRPYRFQMILYKIVYKTKNMLTTIMYNGNIYKSIDSKKLNIKLYAFYRFKKKFHFSPYDYVSKVKVQKQGFCGQVDISTCFLLCVFKI